MKKQNKTTKPVPATNRVPTDAEVRAVVFAWAKEYHPEAHQIVILAYNDVGAGEHVLEIAERTLTPAK